jgi:peroxiredoxin
MKALLISLILSVSSFVLFGQPKIGDQVSDIVLKDANGNVQKLSDLKGKVVLIDFWASWCTPCRWSNRELRGLYTNYKDKGFEIFGVSLDKNEKDWKKAISTDKIKWKQVTEPGGWEAPVALAWKIEQLPASFLIDKDGKLIMLDPTKKQLEAELKKLLP